MLSREDNAIDTRALALFRIGLGILLIADIFLRARNFELYYTDNGVVPYSLFADRAFGIPTADFPIYVLSSHPSIMAVLFSVSIVVGVCLITGYKTRFMTVLGFLLVSAIDARNPFLLSYADIFYHLMFLWGMFLPLGERWSLDAVRYDSTSVKSSVSNIWSGLILSQVVIMYVANGREKLVLADFSLPVDLLPVLLSLDKVTYSNVHLISVHVPTPLIQAVSASWMVLMLSSPLLFFLRGHKRTIFTSCFIIAHVSMAATMRIGAFPYIVLFALILFIPTITWDSIEQFITRAPHTTIVKNWVDETSRRIVTILSILEPSLETEQQIKQITLRTALGVFIIASLTVTGLFIGGVTNITENSEQTAVEYVEGTVQGLGLYQPPWDFYTSPPPYNDTYYVMAAETANGGEIDVYNDRELSFERPYDDGDLHLQYSTTYRERFFMSNVFDGNIASGENITYANKLRDEITQYHCTNNSDLNAHSDSDGEIQNISFYEISEEITMETRENRDSRKVVKEYYGTYECN